MSFGSGGQSSSSTRGLAPDEHAYFSDKSRNLFTDTEGFSREAANDSGGLQYMSTVDQLLPLGRYGLPTSATEGTYQLGRDLFTQASGSRAQRGFSTPNNIEAVVGDAVRMASGQLIPQSIQMALTRAQMAPALRQAAFGYRMTPMQTLSNLLASSGASQGSGSQSSFDGSSLIGPGIAAALAAKTAAVGGTIAVAF